MLVGIILSVPFSFQLSLLTRLLNVIIKIYLLDGAPMALKCTRLCAFNLRRE